MRVAIDVLPGLGAGVGRWQRETVAALASLPPSESVTLGAFALGKRAPRPAWLPDAVAFHVSSWPGRVQLGMNQHLGIPAEWIYGLGTVDVLLEMNLTPLQTRRPLVLAVADVSWRYFDAQYRTTFSPQQIRSAELAIRTADHILTLSQASAQALQDRGCEARRITVAPLGVAEEFRCVPAAEVERVRASYQLPDQFVLYVGGLNERKNLAVLRQAMEQLSPRCPWIVAGPPPAESLAFWGLDQPWTRHLGYLPDGDMPGLFAAATIKVFPSRLEGLGLPLLEAMSVGTPVLASDIPVFHEVAGEAVQYFAPDNSAELRSLLRKYLDSPALRADYAGRGKERAARFTRANYASQVLQALKSAMGGRANTG